MHLQKERDNGSRDVYVERVDIVEIKLLVK